MHPIGKSKTAIITRDGENIIKQIVKGYSDKFDIFKNEVKWLEKMEDFDNVPTIIEYDSATKTIVTKYLGDLISRDTVPVDWKNQIREIVDKLIEYGCSHNDIKPREIVVKDGIISLVDFGWATPLGEKIPSFFPRSLGSSQFRYSVLKFDDFYSFKKSIKHIIKGNK